MRVIGLDPGLGTTGWGVIDVAGSGLRHVGDGVVVSDTRRGLAERLLQLAEGLEEIVARYRPDEAAVEETFVNRNAVSTLRLGQARGIALLVAGAGRSRGRRIPAEPGQEDGRRRRPCGETAGADDGPGAATGSPPADGGCRRRARRRHLPRPSPADRAPASPGGGGGDGLIGKLAGRIDAIDETTALIDVGGVGYVATCSPRTLSALTIDAPAVLFIETLVREDAITLFGFADGGERQLFRLLLTVQGVGPKAALAILGALSADALTTAIATGDRGAIMRAPGVGARLAARITGELADRIGPLVARIPRTGAGLGMAATAGPTTAAGDAVSALVNLGFRASDAHAAVGRIAGRLGEGAAIEALIRGGLAELAAKDIGKEAGG